MKIDRAVMDLLDELKNRPTFFLDKKSLYLLSAFLGGYWDAKYRENPEDSETLIPGFQEWIEKKYHIKTSHHWSSIITFMTATDERAFDMFYELFEEFKKKKGIK